MPARANRRPGWRAGIRVKWTLRVLAAGDRREADRMSAGGDKSAWTSLVLLERFRRGHERAAAEIFDCYFQRLAGLARSRLSPRLASRTDPEDIVLSVYRSFFSGARRGRYALR